MSRCLILESCSTSCPQAFVPPFPLSSLFSSCLLQIIFFTHTLASSSISSDVALLLWSLSRFQIINRLLSHLQPNGTNSVCLVFLMMSRLVIHYKCSYYPLFLMFHSMLEAMPDWKQWRETRLFRLVTLPKLFSHLYSTETL